MKLELFLRSLVDSETFGRLIGESSCEGDVIFLSGTLGAGKTTLTGFIAQGLGIQDKYITSPSFSLMNQYFGRMPLYHIDCYRLEGEDDVEGSGIIDYIVADGLTVIEWPDRLGSLTPDNRLEINLNSGQNEERFVTLTAHGQGWQERLSALQRSLADASLEEIQ